MKFFKRFRWWIMLPLPVLIICANSFGPDGWIEPAARLLWLSWASVALAGAHVGTKALHDYASGQQAWSEAMRGNVAAGIAFLGRCILGGIIFASLMNYAKADVRTDVPANARPLIPMVNQQIDETWPAMTFRSYLGALVEQETCLSLTHSRCWSTKARLKTAREEGAGLAQLTRAWDKDGKLRFDALEEVKTLDPKALKDLNWTTVYERADLTLKAMLLKLKDCDTRMQRQTSVDVRNRMAFCDAAYNGGFGAMMNERQMCALTKGCDANAWFGNVEHHSGKSRAKWQGYGKSAFEINREHVQLAVVTRRPKYIALLGGET